MAEYNGLNGQWIGDYADQASGRVIVDFDDVGSHYDGYAYVKPARAGTLPSFVQLKVPKGSTEFHLTDVTVFAVNPTTAQPDFSGAIRQQYPGITFPSKVAVHGRWNAEQLSVEWNTDQGITGAAVLPRGRGCAASNLIAKTLTWNDFKNAMGRLEGQRFLFRGQEQPWRLRTAFHRAGRANLFRFRNVDVPALHRYLSARTRHVFDLSEAHELGSFINLAQHHGYPTPLLDWTYSPYVAAFFAFRKINSQRLVAAKSAEVVRIFQFDQQLWRETFRQILSFFSSGEHVSVLEPLAIDNERLIPQQSAVSVTNVDDIETYISRCESNTGKCYLEAIDIPISERDSVINELRFMGITAGSMFPGLDGACEELRQQFFRD